jgi:hypothetical protein
MIDTLGPYLLILTFTIGQGGGLAIHEMSSFESCQAALVQLEAVRQLRGYCIAKELRE